MIPPRRTKNYVSGILLIATTIIAFGVTTFGAVNDIGSYNLILTDTVSIPINSMTLVLGGAVIFMLGAVLAFLIEVIFYG